MITPLAFRLSDPDLLAEKAFVGGQWVHADNGDNFPVINPSTGETLANVPNMGRAETARAIDSAKAAQSGWAERTSGERGLVLRRWHDLIMTHQEDLAIILTAEMGKPLPEARGEIAYGAAFIQWFAEEAKRIYGDIIPGHTQDARIMVLKQPVGVVGAITPWNFPNAMITRKAAPALSVGCTMVCKPAQQTPLSALAIAVLAERAGFPAGIFNVITSASGSTVGMEFCNHPDLRKLSFTGSTEVGRILMRQCAGQIKKVSLELGGNAPFIVFEDADIDAAVAGVISSKFRNGGQTCVCTNRIYVQSAVHDAFVERLTIAVADLRIGDGFEADVTIGPLIDSTACDKVADHIADACAKGAKVLIGGKPHPSGQNFFEPTVLVGVTSAMLVAREETFGPLAPVFRFETLDDVIAQANDTIFGLAAYFYTRDITRVWKVAEALEYGIVGVNTGLISTEVAPFGGVKQSGMGREGSKYGVEEYLEIKNVCLGGIL